MAPTSSPRHVTPVVVVVKEADSNGFIRGNGSIGGDGDNPTESEEANDDMPTLIEDITEGESGAETNRPVCSGLCGRPLLSPLPAAVDADANANVEDGDDKDDCDVSRENGGGDDFEENDGALEPKENCHRSGFRHGLVLVSSDHRDDETEREKDQESRGDHVDGETASGNDELYDYEDEDNSMEEYHEEDSGASIEYLDASEDDDEEEENSSSDHEMPMEMYQLFHMIARMEQAQIYSDLEEHDGSYDGSYDDSSDEDHSDEDYDPYNDDGDSDPCTCPRCLMERIVGDDYDEDYSVDDDNDTPLDPEASPCAICLEAETKLRRFAHLPCCGVRTKGSLVDTSSTRFCQKCLAKHLVTNGSAIPCRHGTGAQLAGECPRCKKLLVLEECSPESETDDSGMNTPLGRLPLHQRTHAVVPSTDALFWYIAGPTKGRGGVPDVGYRTYLLTLAFCPNPRFVPEELLLNNHESPEKVRNLCQWGLLSRRTHTREPLQWLLRATRNSRLQTLLDQQWRHNRLLNCLRRQSIKLAMGPWLQAIYRRVHALRQLPNSAGIIYQIDPSIQSDLRALVLRHLQCCMNGDEFNSDCDCDYDYDHGEDTALRLLPPTRSSSEDDCEEMEAFCVNNSRRQCFLVAWNSFCSAWMAACRFRFFRSLRLINHGLSLALLSSKHVGLSPITTWPPTRPSPESLKGIDSAFSTDSRWRWHSMSVWNAILVVLAFQIVVHLIWIAFYLLLAASLCHILGSLMEPVLKPPDRRLMKKRIFYTGFLILYATWYTFSYLAIRSDNV